MRRESHNKERGGAKLKLVVMLVFLGSMIFAGFKIIPAYFANYQLQDAMKTEAQFAASSYPKKTVDTIRGDVWKKAQELGIPVQKEDIVVSMSSSNGTVDIDLDYAVTFDLAVTQWTHDFHSHADNHSI